jgi:uncharacterized protein YaiL (DUF2058 family)
MPKKKNQESQEDQSKRFKAEVQRLIAAGELNPTEADKAFELLMGKVIFLAKNIDK